MEDRRLYSSLTLFGALPFIACALLPLVGFATFGPLGDLDRLAATYGLAILSFLTGIHWATQLYTPRKTPLNLFMASNVVFLLVLFTYLAASLQIAIASQVIALLFLLVVDDRLQYVGLITSDYLRIRVSATALACVSLLAILIF